MDKRGQCVLCYESTNRASEIRFRGQMRELPFPSLAPRFYRTACGVPPLCCEAAFFFLGCCGLCDHGTRNLCRAYHEIS